jgi:acylphosphatase
LAENRNFLFGSDNQLSESPTLDLEKWGANSGKITRVPGELARRYLISGRVQGVGYRYFAVRAARELGLRGWVKNLRDGRVEVCAIGPARKLSDLEGELRLGPLRAEVRSMEWEDAVPDIGPDVRIEGFHIR